jgi:hypothetical protein
MDAAMRILPAALLLFGCAAPAPGDSELVAAAQSFPAPAGKVVPLQLAHAAFPASGSRPNALWYVPSGFDATPPLDVIVYLHGFYNCIENIIASKNGPCSPQGPARNAYGLAAQLDGAGKSVLLLAPELPYDQASSDPGALANDGTLAAMLGEALGQLPSGSATLDDLGSVIVASHSGGYRAAAGSAQRGGVAVSEVWLLDSLYGDTADFDAWMQRDLGSFSDGTRRFADVYTGAAGTLANSQAMARRAAGWLPATALVDDRTTSTWLGVTFRHGALFKRSGLAHDAVPRYYFGKLVATSSVLR